MYFQDHFDNRIPKFRKNKSQNANFNNNFASINISRLPNDLTQSFKKAQKEVQNLKNDIETNFLSPELKELLAKDNEDKNSPPNKEYQTIITSDIFLPVHKATRPKGLSHINSEEFNMRLAFHRPLKKSIEEIKLISMKLRSQSKE